MLSVVFFSVTTGRSFPVKSYTFIGYLALWIGFYKYARSHELLRRSKALYAYHMRRLRGYTTVEKYDTRMQNNQMAHSLYPIQKIGKNGLIHFGGKKYGYLILCTPRKTVDDEAVQQIANIEKFLNSLHHNILFKISARSQIPGTNAVQEMTAKKINP